MDPPGDLLYMLLLAFALQMHIIPHPLCRCLARIWMCLLVAEILATGLKVQSLQAVELKMAEKIGTIEPFCDNII